MIHRFRWPLFATGILLGVVLPAIASGSEPSLRDISYGPHKENTFDLWKAPSAAPAPLIVHIHGGGFVRGAKSSFGGSDAANLEKALQSGISLATINYRFLGTASLHDILRDCARAVQFMRYNAAQWNLDKTRVAVYGGSAGGGTALWLAFHDDLADPASPDPVLRESTRLTAAAGLNAQATYDFVQWPAILGISEYIWFVSMPWIAPKYYRLSPRQTMLEQAGKRLRADLDMLAWMDAGDPPVYISCSRADLPLTGASLLRSLRKGALLDPSESPSKSLADVDILHHPAHTHAVERACKEKGVSCVAVYRETPEEKRVGVYAFLIAQLLRK